jgi:calcium-dependent protein kinase
LVASTIATKTTSSTGSSLSSILRDLKPENILLEANKDFDQIKIIDFGTSLTFDPSKALDEKLGTPYYIAPEVLKKSYNEKCDIWSCGVILFILLSGTPPFNGSNDNAIMQKVKSGKYSMSGPEWDKITDDAKDLINKMLTLDKDKRISAEECTQHKWIKEYSECKVDTSQAQGALSNLKGFKVNTLTLINRLSKN